MTTRNHTLDALVFDAYGTLLDVHSIATRAESLVPGHGADLSRRWRVKQLEYTWLQSLMHPTGRGRDDFAGVTALALEYAVAELALPLDAAARRELCDAYLALDAFPDAVPALTALAPRPRWILSNGTLRMLEPALRHAGIAELLDGVLSVDAAGIYKPAPAVYRLAAERLGIAPPRIGFVSSNGWDITGARAFGFTTFWVNRAEMPVERHGPAPHHILATLAELPNLLGA
jgi:2-haloacid dehalogenase